MEHTPDAFADALSSGDADRVNRAVDKVQNMDLEDRAALFDDCFEMCREIYEEGDGYQRQSAIRFAAAVYPRLGYRAVGGEFTDDALPGTFTVEETATHRDRLRELYLNALVDDDGRVRRAAAKAIKEVALTAEMIGANDELQMMLEALESLATHQPESKTKHIEQAYKNVGFHAEKSVSSLPEGLQDATQPSDSIDSKSQLERYRRYRKVGRELNSKILSQCTDREAILESARILGIERDDDAILYEAEPDMTVHYEFVLNEYRQNGQTAVEKYYTQERWETETERTILEALLGGETSLFKITAIDEADKHLIVTDLLKDDDNEIGVTDINLCETAEPGVLLFFRLVPYDEFNMTSGVSFPFLADEEDRLLHEYEHRTDHIDSQPESVQRFVEFFDLYRDIGIHIQYL
ncbi:hypothetical protein ACLI4Q_19035 [Natrialbaceae archaeon A-CW1-1]